MGKKESKWKKTHPPKQQEASPCCRLPTETFRALKRKSSQSLCTYTCGRSLDPPNKKGGQSFARFVWRSKKAFQSLEVWLSWVEVHHEEGNVWEVFPSQVVQLYLHEYAGSILILKKNHLIINAKHLETVEPTGASSSASEKGSILSQKSRSKGNLLLHITSQGDLIASFNFWNSWADVIAGLRKLSLLQLENRPKNHFCFHQKTAPARRCLHRFWHEFGLLGWVPWLCPAEERINKKQTFSHCKSSICILTHGCFFSISAAQSLLEAHPLPQSLELFFSSDKTRVTKRLHTKKTKQTYIPGKTHTYLTLRWVFTPVTYLTNLPGKLLV